MPRPSPLRLLAVLLAALLAVACGGPDGARRAVVQNKGSDTLFDGAQAWAERYRQVNPSVAVAVNGGGSGVGISALINGTVDIANSSRPIHPSELEEARRHGADPQEFVVGYDAIVVYVYASNPLEDITLAQLAEIYGEGGATQHWKDLGVAVPGCDRDEMVLVGRQNSSGTYQYFREAVLGNQRDYRMGTHDMHGSKDVVDLVEHTPCAIGYSGLAYATKSVKVLRVATKEGERGVAPSVASALDRTYPISRPLFMYTRTKPSGAVKDYLDWILGDDGQRLLAERGYAPVRPLPPAPEASSPR